jgi:hypothetical protein
MTSFTAARIPRAPASALLVVAFGLAVALDSAIAAIAHANGASHAFQPLQFPSYTMLTGIGMVAGAAGWAAVRAKAAQPRRLLSGLVPIILVLSFVPDVLVGAGTMAGASWGAVAALMVMHVAVATVLITTLLRVLPVPADDKKA